MYNLGKKNNQMWQERWDREEKGRHLYQIHKSVKVNRVGSGNRREETVNKIEVGTLCTKKITENDNRETSNRFV